MSSPVELLAAAKQICSIADDEAMRRAAINRLYFSSFHLCGEYHRGLPLPGSVGVKRGRHEQLIAQLLNPDPKLLANDKNRSVMIGKELRMLAAKRVDADYNCQIAISSRDMELAQQATDLIFANA